MQGIDFWIPFVKLLVNFFNFMFFIKDSKKKSSFSVLKLQNFMQISFEDPPLTTHHNSLKTSLKLTTLIECNLTLKLDIHTLLIELKISTSVSHFLNIIMILKFTELCFNDFLLFAICIQKCIKAISNCWILQIKV